MLHQRSIPDVSLKNKHDKESSVHNRFKMLGIFHDKNSEG